MKYETLPMASMLKIALLWACATPVLGGNNWWQSSSGSTEYDTLRYGSSMDRDWLYNAGSISLKLEGCILGYNTADSEDAGCPENDSEDGTVYWYQMANCLRPQAVFSLYASDSGSTSCSSSTFKESFITTFGFGEFIYYLSKYDENSPFNQQNDDYYGSDDYFSQNGGFNVENMPVCEESGDGYYVGLGCSEYGDFVLKQYIDENCFQPASDSDYESLSNINSLLSFYKDCSSAYSNGNDQDNSLAHNLVYYSDSCSSLDNSLCQNDDAMSSMLSSTKTTSASKAKAQAGSKSWVTKLKYVAGGMLLVASFVMFTGILFTNRRRRRALMQRKYRQSKKSRSSRSKSRGYDAESRRSSARSKSRNREKDRDADPSGVFT